MASTDKIQGVPLYSVEQVREFDRLAIEEMGIDSYSLMEQAAEAAFAALLVQWPQVRNLLVFAGTGNNAGDGYVMARLAQQHEIDVQLIALTPLSALKGDAKRAAEAAVSDGIAPIQLDEIEWPQSGVVVDALLGTGLKGPVTGDYQSAIELMNQHALPVLSVDIPSGLDGTTGAVHGVAVKADMTVTMVANKQGLYTGHGPVVAGDVRLARLGLTDELFKRQNNQQDLINWHSIHRQQWLSPRAADSHKGDHGHVMIIGGDLGLGGACIMAAGAALRSGAGRVSVATRPEHVSALLARYPEVMAHGVQSGQDLQPLLTAADVIVIGPGLGTNYWGQQLLQQVMAIDTPVVLDADALNILSDGRLQHNLAERLSVLTPHPGEAGRLLKQPAQTIQQDRIVAAKQLAELFSSVVILKGLGSLVSTETRTSICTDGNPGMASAGMGDVLSGVLGAIVAVHSAHELTLSDAVKLGVCLHSAAADDAAAQGQKGMLATELLPAIRQLVN